jgi:hypothetical protein
VLTPPLPLWPAPLCRPGRAALRRIDRGAIDPPRRSRGGRGDGRIELGASLAGCGAGRRGATELARRRPPSPVQRVRTGTGRGASSIRRADTRRSDNGEALRRRAPSARSTGRRPCASQVVPSSRSPWSGAPRPGGAVPQAIGSLGRALDTVRGFRDFRTSGWPWARAICEIGAVGHPPDAAKPSHQEGLRPWWGSGGALLRLPLPPRDVGVDGFVLPAVLPLVVSRQLRAAARRLAHAALRVRPVRSGQRANRRPPEPVVLHAVTSFPGARSDGHGVEPPRTVYEQLRTPVHSATTHPDGPTAVHGTVRNDADTGR